MALQTFTAGQVLTAAQVTALQTNDFNQTVSTKTDSYTLVAADKGTRVVMNKATATTITVNTSLFSAGDTLWIHNVGAGVCTITAGTATVSTSGSLALAQNAGGTLYFTSTGVAIFFPTVASSAQGMTLINTTSFSAVASQSVNDVFSTTYQNYRIVLNISSQNTAGNAVNMRLRVSGSDASTNYFTYSYHTRTSLGAIGADNGNPGSFFWVGYANPTYPTAGVTDMYSPFETRRTVGTMQFMGGDSSTFLGSQGGFVHDTSASYTGFTILAASGGTITGNVRVYGYNN